MRRQKLLVNGLIGATALGFALSTFDSEPAQNGPVLTKAVEFVSGEVTPRPDSAASPAGASAAETAVAALGSRVRKLSHPEALETAFESYFAFRAENPEQVRKPYLYFVDYGLSSTEPRGYVFDMDKLEIVDGPFTVAHGRGSSRSRLGIPTRFSNAPGSAATSLGLYLA
ncbi:MAG TPA: murein L,D-transpeptidase catalytic domain family protein, partial [Gemmatimonadaceae bacterium]|nr:murein L,D-transpeptidase catalytic domain family protein [Gemmatimonadaceae bacterium]